MKKVLTLRSNVVLIAISIALLILLNFIPETFRPIPVALVLVLVFLRFLMPWIKKRTVTYEVDDTLIYLVTHMYAVSTGKPHRRRIFELNNIAGGYGDYDRILRRIATLAVEWGFGFAKAIRVVVKETRNKVFRDFLMRLGELLNIGEDPEIFLDVERRALLTEMQAHYGRIVEATKLLLGVYTSSVSSSMFMAITVIIFSMLFSSSVNTVIAAYIGIAAALIFLVYVLYRMLPRERLTHNIGEYPPERTKYRILLIIGISLSIVIGLVIYGYSGNPSLAMSLGALPLLIPGFYAKKIEKKIREIEAFFPIFVRSFGLTYATVPHTPKALTSTLRSNYGPLTRYLQRLLARLTIGVDPKVSWRKLIVETWSELLRRNVNVLFDAIDAGGDLANVGTVLSETSFRIMDIRKQRIQVTKAFESTVYIIHSLLVAVLTFVLELLSIFYKLMLTLQTVESGLHTILPFQPIPLDTTILATVVFIIVMAITNAFAIKVAQGGMYETVWVPLSVLLAISGLVMFGIKFMTSMMFAELLELTETFTTTV